MELVNQWFPMLSPPVQYRLVSIVKLFGIIYPVLYYNITIKYPKMFAK